MVSISLALLASALGYLSCVNAAISILSPNSQTTWYKNSTVQLTWSSAAGDPNPFRIFLDSTEGALSANATLADSVNTDLQGLTILLPQLTDSDGYLLYFVNTTNTSQVYATSQPFTIAAGEFYTSSATGATNAASATSAGIPGPYTPFSSTGVRTATGTVSPAATASGTSDAAALKAYPLAVYAVAGLGIIAGAMVV
ncbi:hypothetical protein NliqN6_3964 [Naganishia liquefaciens]|uniref:Yeast cell wall synthesis Kre9/Knh1-like N-terminal domain-containing protein n=1 Tax=Naganishia liquefaciens TaxID=104408 RepID=A0A8H3TUT7_9TREE|nr:hypothetical protein NliqN6_3964 [Naganishia liquefaciens]